MQRTQSVQHFHLSRFNFGQTTNLSLDRSFQCCHSIHKKEHPKGVAFLSFFFSFKKEEFETARWRNECVNQELFQCSHMETVRSGTNVRMGCIYHITFRLSVLSTDTWHCFSNSSTWADSTELMPWLPLHCIPIETKSIPVKHRQSSSVNSKHLSK